ncbi:hypothetical protein [Desulfomonile tiedjei]|uniref:Uncharacterized protein n=1 Tax=Desulfomonile tiedjei (strain ATCC 49306 / DSM 6799 / DCB-1) TaxID=706587 RepID=I4C8T6_DESTA|nr:hypothetical protein [Desulfomonile tiedjei]AFM25977.1 hypothetical protein Desti_3319 [Desulfomonile tiedjei DSM 6799]
MILSVCQALGIQWNGGMYEGEIRGSLSSQNLAKMEAAKNLPQEFSDFLRIDLENDPSALALKMLVNQEEWSRLKQFQCDKIRSVRAECYRQESDGMFFAYEGDGDSRQLWLDRRNEIKVRHPWPGDYR